MFGNSHFHTPFTSIATNKIIFLSRYVMVCSSLSVAGVFLLIHGSSCPSPCKSSKNDELSLIMKGYELDVKDERVRRG